MNIAIPQSVLEVYWRTVQRHWQAMLRTYFIGKVDPRTANWPMVATPYPLLTILLLYWATIKLGNAWMKRRKAYDLRVVMILYNILLVVLSAYISFELSICSIFRPGFNVWCQPVDNRDEYWSNRLAAALWWYYISKSIELFDTVIFVLRKKTRQISFLHVYHHSSMPCLWYLGSRYVPGGCASGGPLLNSVVHVIMYSYYLLMALGPSVRKYVWWKRYLTTLQLVQFVFIFGASLNTVRLDCGVPILWPLLQSAYCLSLFFLFGNFYYINYVKPAFTINIRDALYPVPLFRNGRPTRKDE